MNAITCIEGDGYHGRRMQGGYLIYFSGMFFFRQGLVGHIFGKTLILLDQKKIPLHFYRKRRKVVSQLLLFGLLLALQLWGTTEARQQRLKRQGKGIYANALYL